MSEPSVPGPKTWGPFTGRQLTIMAVTLIVMVAFPVSAFAVSGSPVFITDVHNGKNAAVDTSYNLQTKVNGGSIIATKAGPKDLFTGQKTVVHGAGWVVVTKPPSGKALVITEIHSNALADPTPGTGDGIIFSDSKVDATCGQEPWRFQEEINPPTVGMTELHYSAGVVIPANRALCAIAFGNVTIQIDVTGYLVPAAAAPAGG